MIEAKTAHGLVLAALGARARRSALAVFIEPDGRGQALQLMGYDGRFTVLNVECLPSPRHGQRFKVDNLWCPGPRPAGDVDLGQEMPSVHLDVNVFDGERMNLAGFDFRHRQQHEPTHGTASSR